MPRSWLAKLGWAHSKEAASRDNSSAKLLLTQLASDPTLRAATGDSAGAKGDRDAGTIAAAGAAAALAAVDGLPGGSTRTAPFRALERSSFFNLFGFSLPDPAPPDVPAPENASRVPNEPPMPPPGPPPPRPSRAPSVTGSHASNASRKSSNLSRERAPAAESLSPDRPTSLFRAVPTPDSRASAAHVPASASAADGALAAAGVGGAAAAAAHAGRAMSAGGGAASSSADGAAASSSAAASAEGGGTSAAAAAASGMGRYAPMPHGALTTRPFLTWPDLTPLFLTWQVSPAPS
jgi:hypothetical protein